MLDGPLTGDAAADARAVLGAIRKGSVFTAIDALAGPALLDFHVDADGTERRHGGGRASDADAMLCRSGDGAAGWRSCAVPRRRRGVELGGRASCSSPHRRGRRLPGRGACRAPRDAAGALARVEPDLLRRPGARSRRRRRPLPPVAGPRRSGLAHREGPGVYCHARHRATERRALDFSSARVSAAASSSRWPISCRRPSRVRRVAFDAPGDRPLRVSVQFRFGRGRRALAEVLLRRPAGSHRSQSRSRTGSLPIAAGPSAPPTLTADLAPVRHRPRQRQPWRFRRGSAISLASSADLGRTSRTRELDSALVILVTSVLVLACSSARRTTPGRSTARSSTRSSGAVRRRAEAGESLPAVRQLARS